METLDRFFASSVASLNESFAKTGQNQICGSKVFPQLLFSSFPCRAHFDDSKSFWKRGPNFPCGSKLEALTVLIVPLFCARKIQTISWGRSNELACAFGSLGRFVSSTPVSPRLVPPGYVPPPLPPAPRPVRHARGPTPRLASSTNHSCCSTPDSPLLPLRESSADSRADAVQHFNQRMIFSTTQRLQAFFLFCAKPHRRELQVLAAYIQIYKLALFKASL